MAQIAPNMPKKAMSITDETMRIRGGIVDSAYSARVLFCVIKYVFMGENAKTTLLVASI